MLMPRILSLTLAFFVLSACEPQDSSSQGTGSALQEMFVSVEKGDIYENKLTQERIEVEEVDQCDSIVRTQEMAKDLAAEMVSEGTLSTQGAIEVVGMLVKDFEKGQGLCAMYTVRKTYRPPSGEVLVMDGKRYTSYPLRHVYVQQLDKFERLHSAL